MHATRRVTFPTILFALLTLTGAPGCDAPVEEELGTIEVRPGGGFSCSWCTLTGNSPIVNGASLADINLDLVNTNGTNTAGIKLRNGNTIDNMEFQLDVDPATERFVGRDAKNPGLTVVSGAGFVGARTGLFPIDEDGNVGEIFSRSLTGSFASLALSRAMHLR